MELIGVLFPSSLAVSVISPQPPERPPKQRKEKPVSEDDEEAMTADRLRELCTRLDGAGRWQTALSKERKVNDRTVRRWASGKARIPHPVALCVTLMVFLDELRDRKSTRLNSSH